jgi:drug/metabolite transporter, DME family
LPIIFGNLIIPPLGFVILAFLGIFQIGVSYVIYNEGIKYVSATESLIIAMLEAVFNPFWVFIGIGEKPSNYALIGGAVILIGIIVHNFIIKGKPEEKIYPEAG